MDPFDHLERGRESYEGRAWAEAHECLTLADKASPLGGDDLERLSFSAFLLGLYSGSINSLERAFRAHLNDGNTVRAARSAFWLTMQFLSRGEIAQASGWLARARRLLEREADCVEHGYLLLPAVEERAAAGDHAASYASAAEATEIGNRFGDADLVAYALHSQGRALIRLGQIEKGLTLLDEGMAAVAAGEVSPLVTGLIYCSVIEACREVSELRRAHEWTAALTAWCEQQPELVTFTGQCLVHRAEIMQLHGAWGDAMEEARKACERFSKGVEQTAVGEAYYQQAEVHRLRGDFVEAEEAYRQASQRGREPQPGLALLRLAQGKTAAAAAAIRRALAETTDRPKRSKLLPAHVEVMLAVDDTEAAHEATGELTEIANEFGTSALDAAAANAQAAVALAEGNPRAALIAARRAWNLWRELGAPYEAARMRLMVAVACRAMGDDDTAAMEFDTARRAFHELGATPDLGRLAALIPKTTPAELSGLTGRELEVLRLIATGKANKVIADELFLSERTVGRHVSNIFAKLGVASRAAATAYAYDHELV